MPGSEVVLIFANPIAGRGRGGLIAQRLHSRLLADGYDARTILEPAEHVAATDIPPDARAMIVIGGDGTLRAVAGRFCTSGCGVPILPVPMGTANLMGQHLGIRWDDLTLENRVSAAIRRRHVRPIDAARANGELFLLVAGVGLDAHIVHELDRLRSGPIDYLSYIVPAATALGLYAYPPLTVIVDTHQVLENRPAMAFIANVAEYGTGFPLAPDARPDDGLLDVCVIPCRSRGDAVAMFLHAAAGEHLQAEGVIYVKGKHVRIDSPEPVPLQVDGDPAGHTPVNIDLLPTRVPFIVPSE